MTFCIQTKILKFKALLLSNEEMRVQFVSDCSVFPLIIIAAQQDKEVLSFLYKVTMPLVSTALE